MENTCLCVSAQDYKDVPGGQLKSFKTVILLLHAFKWQCIFFAGLRKDESEPVSLYKVLKMFWWHFVMNRPVNCMYVQCVEED